MPVTQKRTAVATIIATAATTAAWYRAGLNLRTDRSRAVGVYASNGSMHQQPDYCMGKQVMTAE